MSIDNVKPREFDIYEDGTIETIPYEDGFEYDEDESILFAVEAFLNCDDIVIRVHDFAVNFSLEDILAQGIAQVDAAKHPDDKQFLIDYLLPVLKKAAAELEKRQEAVKA